MGIGFIAMIYEHDYKTIIGTSVIASYSIAVENDVPNYLRLVESNVSTLCPIILEQGFPISITDVGLRKSRPYFKGP